MKLVSIKPHVTEKGTILQEQNKYIVITSKDSNKVSIKQTILAAYGVSVEHVNIINTPQKSRLIKKGQTMTKRPNMKKAIVTLKKGQKLDLAKIKEKK